MNHHQKLDELSRLAVFACEGIIDAEQLDRLDTLLHDDSAAQCAYFRLVELNVGLVWRGQQMDVTPANADSNDSFAITTPISESRTTVPPPTIVAPLLHKSLRTFGMSLRGSAIGMTLLVAGLVYGSFGLFVWQMSQYSPQFGGNVELATRSSSKPAKESVARLISQEGCQWEGKTTDALSVGASLGTEPLRLMTGIARLRFASGATVVLEGPTEFEPRSAGYGFLTRGKLAAVVPSQAVGFTIGTPLANIVDLGTEFGVEVDDQQNAEVHVFKGVVEARQLNSAPRQENGVRVTAGNALRIDHQQRQPTPIAIRSKQQFGFTKHTKIKPIDRKMLVAEWDFLKDQNLTYAANGTSREAKLCGGATVNQGLALGSLSNNPQLMNGVLNAVRLHGAPDDEGLIADAKWNQFFGTSDLTSGSFVVVFKPNPVQWVRCMLMSHVTSVGEFGEVSVSFEQNSTNTVSSVMVRVGADAADATINLPPLQKTDWYFLGASWQPGRKNFLYLRNITEGKLCGTASGNVEVKMHDGVMKHSIHLGLRNSYRNQRDEYELGESANSLLAYAALLYSYWSTAEQFDQFYHSLVQSPGRQSKE